MLGNSGYTSEVANWSLLAQQSLEHTAYAVASEGLHLLRPQHDLLVEHPECRAALKNSIALNVLNSIKCLCLHFKMLLAVWLESWDPCHELVI